MTSWQSLVSAIGACVVLGIGGAAARQSPTAPASQLPALALDGDAAFVTMLVRPDRAAGFESIVSRLRAALLKSTNQARRDQAAAWSVFKSREFVQGNISYIMRIEPPVKGQEYDVVRLISEAYPSEAVDLSQTYRQSVAARSVLNAVRVPIDGLGIGATESQRTGPTSTVAPLLSFDDAEVVLTTILVRPERTSDYEAVLARVGRALQASPRSDRKRQAAGWKVYRGRDTIDGNVPYVMVFDPVELRTEYDPMRLIQEVFPAEVQEAFTRYRAAFVGQAIVRLGDRVDLAK